jgi:hypothetical protein
MLCIGVQTDWNGIALCWLPSNERQAGRNLLNPCSSPDYLDLTDLLFRAIEVQRNLVDGQKPSVFQAESASSTLPLARRKFIKRRLQVSFQGLEFCL